MEARAGEQLAALNAWLERELSDGPFFGGDGSAGPTPAPSLRPGRAKLRYGPADGHAAPRLAPPLPRAPSVAAAFDAARAAAAAMARVAETVSRGQFKRQYRDHRLEWMIRSGGLDIVARGLDRDNIRFTEPPA
jgi:hypothetical protein